MFKSLSNLTFGDLTEKVEAELNRPNKKPKTEEEEERDARKGSQFAEHMKSSSSKGASHFSRTKTLKEQRQFLPAFAVREDLLKVIRENPGEFPSSDLRASVDG
jgi:pre-mRNA-splicing factor ATP-dependent RNA helicase DHX38/PRP16